MTKSQFPPNDSQASSFHALAKPGAGLPAFELFMARMLVGSRAWLTSRRQAEETFADERSRLIELVKQAGETRASKQVLIKRLRGMEDSSRDWSACMTLEHLRIVNAGTTTLIANLVKGVPHDRVIKTADVKPAPGVGIEVVDAFDKVCETFERTVADFSDVELKSKLKWPHPWFGPLDARRWHFFTAFHMGLHRRQIESILKLV